MAMMPKDSTIGRWMRTYGSKKALEKELLGRLDIVEKDYIAKKSKLLYVLKRLKDL